MSANTYNNIAAITRAAMNVLRNNTQLIKRTNNDYEAEFTKHDGQIGDTINVRVPGYGTRTQGKVASPNAYYDTYVPCVVTQKNTSLKFSSRELALNVEEGGEFERSVLGPQMAALINGEEQDGFALYSSIFHSTGTPGTAPVDLQYFLNAKALLADSACPMDDNISCYLNQWTGASMVNGLKSLFQDSNEISKQYVKGKMGISAGMTFFDAQNAVNHTVGALPGTVLTNYVSPFVEGASTLSIDGITSGQGSLKVGDILTIDGVNSVNPVSKQDTGQLMQVVVTAAITDTAGAMAAVAISPALFSSASGGKQNVTALPVDGKSVKIFATANTYAGKVSPANLVLHKDCLTYAVRDLPAVPNSHRVRDRQSGLSLRMVEWYDGVNDDMLYRLDILSGWAVTRPELGVRVQG